MNPHIPPGPFEPSPAFVDWLATLPPPKRSAAHEKALKWKTHYARLRARFAGLKGKQGFIHRQQQNGTHWGTVK